jgi:hypothetical protein
MRYDQPFREPAVSREYGAKGRPDNSGPDRGWSMRRDPAGQWWLGERAMPRQGGRYDTEYEAFSRMNRPRFTPVGGMYGPISGSYVRGVPRPVREPTRFSDWTRWF